MEDLNYIDPLLHGIKPEKKLKISTTHLVCAGLSSLLIGAVLKKTGHNKTAALVGGLAVPLLASACYKKIAQNSKEKIDAASSSGIEYNH